MSPLRAIVAFCAVAAAFLASTQSGLADAGLPLGKNLAGENCTLAESPDTSPAGSPKKLQLLCGGTESLGSLYISTISEALPDDSKARRAAIIDSARNMPEGIGDVSALNCDSGEALSPGGDGLLFSCSLISNGWPRIAIIAANGNSIYQSLGVPSLFPVMAEAMGKVSGRAFSTAETEGGLRILEKRFPQAVAQAGGADVAADASLVELGRLDDAARNFAGAEAAYRRALEIEERLFGKNALTVGETLAELALQVSNQGRFAEAAGLFRRAEPIIDASPSDSPRARLASYLALDAANQRHYEDALKFNKKAIELRRADIGGGESTGDFRAAAGPTFSDPIELAHSLRIEAMMAMRMDDLPTAIAAADELLRIVNDDRGLPLWWRPDSVALMAELNARSGRVVEAERQYREALVMYEKLFGATAPTVLAELKLGQFYADQGLNAAAVAVFRQAITALRKDETARSSVVPDELLPFLTAASALAQRDAQQRQSLQSEIFTASQLIGSDVTSRTIAHAAARMATNDGPLSDLIRDAQNAQRQRDEARIKLAAETAKADDQRDAAVEGTLSLETREFGAKADSLLDQIRLKFPDYSRLADPGPAALDEVRSALRPGEAFLTFVIGDRFSFALLVKPEGLIAQRLDVTLDSLSDDVAHLRTAFIPRFRALPEFNAAAAYTLYRKLLGPIEAGLSDVDHLVVAPRGALASLPFALLVTEPPQSDARQSYERAAWLLRRMSLSQVPSARAFLSLRTEEHNRVVAPRPFLGVGDPTFTGTTGAKGLVELAQRCRDDTPVPADMLRALPPLHETADEVRSVARLFGAGTESLLLGADATETSLRARRLDEYGVIYFATHGVLPGELQCNSEPGLALSPPPTPARSTQEDGLLDASEIAVLKLNADLIVLSACNTAESGVEFGGDALDGLADAFFSAGARAVLASHWEIPSQATVKLLTRMFAKFARGDGDDISKSLRAAQLALISQPDTAHPFYWAGFSLIGDEIMPAGLRSLSMKLEEGHS